MMKRNKKIVMILLAVTLTAMFAVGCESNGNSGNKSDGTPANEGSSRGTTEEMLSPGQFGNENAATNEAPGNNSGEGSVGKDVEQAADDVGDAAKDAADDVADGVGDAIDNLGGGSFDSYEDARDYLIKKLKKDNAEASYEVREENRDLVSYNSNDSGAQGYQFSVYEKDGDEKIGLYYVDKETGKIYRYMGKNSIESY